MTSILTNNGAIVALQTLKMTNKNLAMVQNQIATGKTVNTAADGSAVWAVAKTMETDRDSFATISKGLNVAGKVVAIAVENSDKIVDDLNKIKQRLDGSSNSDQDVKKNWNEIQQLVDGIKAKIDASQINGVNLLNKDGTGAGEDKPYRVLASLDRSYGNAITSHTAIEVQSADLKSKVFDVLNEWVEAVDAAGAEKYISGENHAPKVDFSTFQNDKKKYEDNATSSDDRRALEQKYTAGNLKGATILGKDFKKSDFEVKTTKFEAEYLGTPVTTDLAGTDITQTLFAGDVTTYKDNATTAAKRAELEAHYTRGNVSGKEILGKTYDAATFGDAKTGFATEYTAEKIGRPNAPAVSLEDFAADKAAYAAATAGSAAKTALEAKYTSDGVAGSTVLSKDFEADDFKFATSAFEKEYNGDATGFKDAIKPGKSIEQLIQTTIEETAHLGAKQHRIEGQAEAVGRLVDALSSGIGEMVDADLEAASARLQALQAQQQLGIQALSIANQAPQSVLSLFR